MSAILDRLGVLEAVTKDSVTLEGIEIRRAFPNSRGASPADPA